MDPLEGLAHNLAKAISDYVLAEIHQEKSGHQDSMGAYHEEKALHVAAKELAKGIVAALRTEVR